MLACRCRGTAATIALAAAAGVMLGGAAGGQLAPACLQMAFSIGLVAAAGYVFAHR